VTLVFENQSRSSGSENSLQEFRSLTPVTVLSAASEYSSSMNQKDRTQQLWQYRLSVALDSLYPLQILDFVETTQSDSAT